jgi:hypothetical protein
MGRIYPNLVVIRDSEWLDHAEFRVPCEVIVPKAIADLIQDALDGSSSTTLEDARKLVLDEISRGVPAPSPVFRQLVDLAFKGQQLRYEENSMRRSVPLTQ